MTDIGVLGLDTSHGEAFAEVLRQRREQAASDGPGETGEPDEVDEPTVTAVWDDGTVRSDDYVDEFCADWGATRYDDPSSMVDAVDAAMVLAVDWERHRPLARPFLDAGVPTLVDKPIAGRLADVDALAESSAPLFGGSALPFHPAFDRLPEDSSDRTFHLAGYNDYFYYRVHVVDAVRRVVGADWTSVEPWGETQASIVRASFTDGSRATLQFDGAADDPVYAALDVADRTRTVDVAVDEGALQSMYDGYLDTFLRVVDGTAPDSTDRVLDAARLLLGVEAALSEGRRITPDDPALAAVEKPSASFVADYEPYY